MSMNLRCEQVELWQTPTWFSYICLNKGYEERKYVIDEDWRSILFKYAEWVKHQTDGVWEDNNSYVHMKDSIREHLLELESFDKLDFYIM